jgi:RNA polymerase sigma-70 factor (ECF subfamily)
MGVPPPSDKDFRSLYEATLTPLRRYLTTVLANSHEAQDIAHDAYLRTYTAMQGQEINQPKAFLFTTARRLALNFRIRRGNRMRPEENTVLDRTAADAPDAAQITMARQEREDMAAAIARLPEGCRTVLVLRNLEGLSHQEIALRLDLSRSTVEKHLARALHLLREALAEKPFPKTPDES